MPDQTTVRRALERAELVIVQEAFATTATCAYADLLLPATTWGEKEGTVTNSERRISRVRAAVSAPGETRHDWSIAVDFAQRLERAIGGRGEIGVRSRLPESATPVDGSVDRALTPILPMTPIPVTLPIAVPTLFPYTTPEQIWHEHRESTRARDLDITGLTYALLEQAPQQWPCPEGAKTGKQRLYEDAIFPTPDGRAKFVNTVYKPLAEPRESRYPFSLTTGRLRDQWHGMSRTGTLGRLFGHVAEPSIQMNPQDMARRLLKEGDLVYVTSKRGSIVVPLQASAEVGMSQAFMAMHWGEEYLSGSSSTGVPLAGVNALTTSVYCPSSKQPELKHAAVKILKAELPWSLLCVAWLPEDKVLAAREQLVALMRCFPFATCVPFSNNSPLADAAKARHGVLFRAAAHEAPPPQLLAQIESIVGLDAKDNLRYVDRKRGQHRVARLVPSHNEDGQAMLQGFLLAGDTSAEAWIKTVLQDELPAQSYGRLLLLPGAKAPVAVQSRGKQICSCFNVTDVAIAAELQRCSGDDSTRLAQLQSALKCGTNCGSCLPELKGLVRMNSGDAVTA